MAREQDLANRVRGLLRELDPEQGEETFGEALAVISDASGCESVGIRWRAGEDYPYYATRGFGRNFLVVEGPLCVRDSAGLILRHPDGTVQLACMCGAVIQGWVDLGSPFFTENGSFWTNGTSEVRSKGLVPKGAIELRHYCNISGYESVALIPLKGRDGICGLLQLNSREPGRFTAEKMQKYEAVAAVIAGVLEGKVG